MAAMRTRPIQSQAENGVCSHKAAMTMAPAGSATPRRLPFTEPTSDTP